MTILLLFQKLVDPSSHFSAISLYRPQFSCDTAEVGKANSGAERWSIYDTCWNWYSSLLLSQSLGGTAWSRSNEITGRKSMG